MSLIDRLGSLITAVGADIKSLQTQINGMEPPWTHKIHSGANVTNSTTTFADITALTIPTTLVAGTYELEGRVFFSSAAVTTAMYLTMVYPAQVVPGISWQIPDGQYNLSILNQGVSAEAAGGAAAPGISPKRYAAMLDGMFTVTGAMASVAKVQFRSEIAGSLITVFPGTFIRYRRML